MKRYRLRLDVDDELVADSLYQAWEIFSKRVREGFYGPAMAHVEEILGSEDDFRDYPPRDEQQQTEPEPQDTRRKQEGWSPDYQWPWKPGAKPR